MTSYLPAFVTNSISRTNDSIRRMLGDASWGPLVALSRKTVTALFARIEDGTLILRETSTGRMELYGQNIVRESAPATTGALGPDDRHKTAGKVELVVHKDAFWVRLLLFADIGFAEAYMLGECECSDLNGFLKVCYDPVAMFPVTRLTAPSSISTIVSNWRMRQL